MKLGVDLRPLVPGVSGGIAPLVARAVEHAIRLHPEHEFLLFCTPFNRRLIETQAANVRYFSLPAKGFYPALDEALRKEPVDVLFHAYPKEEALRFPANRQIFLIPDIQHEAYPEFFDAASLRSRRLAFARALRSAGAIATISNFSRETLLAFRETRCEDVFLMEPGPNLSGPAAAPGEDELALLPSQPFLLFPANLWPHKNHERLLAAFRRFKEKDTRDVALVLTGHPEGWPALAERHRGLPVRHCGFVSPGLLRRLYERAQALMFFSLYEGFGMPLLEAFDAGTPVLCSNTTSLPEVGGDAVLSCDPTDPGAMAALMERILADGPLRQALVERGKARLGRYAWDKSAEALVAACGRVHARAALPPAPRLLAREPLPMVSIVTPSFNQGRFLQRTLDSVRDQNYPRIEHVVIDGGSTDETVGLLRARGDALEWTSEPDRGQSHAINKGMARTHGSIVAYLNSDDVLLPGAIDRVVRHFQEHPECDAVYGDADHIDEFDAVIGPYPTAEYSFDRLVENCMVCQPAMFWRREIAQKVGPFDEDLHYAMDYDYWFRIARAGGTIHYLPEKLACSRLHPGAKTLTTRDRIYAEIFRTSDKHAGRIHRSYIDGYWHYLVHERHGVASRLARRIPGLFLELAWIHWHWHHRRNYPWKVVLGFLALDLPRHYLRMWAEVFRGLLRPSQAPPRGAAVSGIWPDNWLSPDVRIAGRAMPPGTILYLGGIPSTNLTMRIQAGPTEIGAYRFDAHKYERVSFTAGAAAGHPLRLQFSAFVTDAAGRRLSFQLQETNAFTEQDVA